MHSFLDLKIQKALAAKPRSPGGITKDQHSPGPQAASTMFIVAGARREHKGVRRMQVRADVYVIRVAGGNRLIRTFRSKLAVIYTRRLTGSGI